MFEFAAFGFVTLVWWTWPAIAGIVFGSMYLAMLVSTRRERKEEAAGGPYPCLAHLGTEPDGMEWWCWLREGHAGVHLNQWGVDVNQPMVEPGGPDDDMVPVGGGLCGWGEDGDGNESACWKPYGHDGPHMVMEKAAWQSPDPHPMTVCLRSSNCYLRSSNCYLRNEHEGDCQLDYSDRPGSLDQDRDLVMDAGGHVYDSEDYPEQNFHS